MNTLSFCLCLSLSVLYAQYMCVYIMCIVYLAIILYYKVFLDHEWPEVTKMPRGEAVDKSQGPLGFPDPSKNWVSTH